MLGIPTLKRLEGIVNVKLEPVTVENEAPIGKNILKITKKYHGNSVKIEDHKNTPPKLEDSLDTKIGEDDLGSKLNIKDFVSKALDSFLHIQEKKSFGICISRRPNSRTYGRSFMSKKLTSNEENMYLGLVNPIQGPQHMELQQAEYCSAFGKVGGKICKSAANTKNREV